MNPTDRKYHPKHMWAKVDNDVALIGITDLAQKKLNNVVFIELPKAGDRVEQGKTMGKIESVKSVSDLISPVTGEVIDINEELLNTPEIVNSHPYDKGWIAKIKLETWETRKREIDKLLSAEEYEKGG